MNTSLRLLFNGFSLLLLTALPGHAAQVTLPQAVPAALFSDAERAKIVAAWNAPNRYEIGAREDAKANGIFVVRLTPEASTWFSAYNRALRPQQLAATKNATEITPATKPWENWVDAKLKFDRALAAQQAKSANAQLFQVASVGDKETQTPGAALQAAPLTLPPAPQIPLVTEALPPHPGPIPPALLAAIGNPPPFAACVAPLRHTVRFESGETFVYTDHISPSNPRNPSFRFAQGVASSGTALSTIATAELDQIFAASQLSPTEARVMRAISRFEGGFDSINTYDTGFVSVGFIQFACLEGGAGSLGGVLQFEKATDPLNFARDFHDFGVDVSPDGALVVLDPASGAEVSGNQAARKIIDDKRLIAVFHLAGRRSTAFRAAQIHVAKSGYYPADFPIEVTLGDQTLTGRVSDVIGSEAGLATLFDRKVNTGNVRPINQLLQQLMLQHGLTKFSQVAPFERELVTALKWRGDFLKDATLTQPL